MPNPRLSSPLPLIQGLLQSGSPVFITPEFLPCIAALPAAEKALFPAPEECAAGARDKSLFWKLNREHHYGCLLVGASPAWKSLTDSLLNSPLWILSDVSPWGYLFKPEASGITEWRLPSEKELEKSWPRPADRARFLILTAANLAAINRLPEAEQLLGSAEATHKLPSLLLSTRASIEAFRGHWNKAVSLSKASLRADRSNKAAQEILIRALIETGHTDEALEQARDLVSLDDKNTDALFLFARAASAAHSDKEEIQALKQLVAVATKNRLPLGASLTYLGQAYAKSGERGEALRTFQQALLSPELTDEQRTVIHDIMDHLMEGNTPSNTLPALPTPGATPP